MFRIGSNMLNPASIMRWSASLLIGAALGHAACFPPGWPRQEPPLYLTNDQAFDVGPYLVLLRPGRVAIVVQDQLDQPPRIRWRTTTSSQTRAISAEPFDDLWVAVLPELPVNQTYEYEVESGNRTAGPIPFRVGRPRKEAFSFAAFGDTRTNHEVHRALILDLARERAEFVIHSGDLVETGGAEDQWRQFFQIEAPVMSGRPVLAAVGNHDNSRRMYFRRYFLMGLINEGHRYYTQDWGDVRVITMDSEIEARAGSAQYAYVEKMLKEGAERDMILILNLHYPPYSSGAHGSTRETRTIIGELAPRFGVELVLAGHDHDYERTKRIDGVTYIVAASGGAPIRRVQPSWFTAKVRTEPHFVLFDVERDTLVGRAVNLSGDTFDTFVIPKNPPREPPPATAVDPSALP